MNGDKYDYLFLFDHSNGHDRVRPDALSASAIRKGYGGSQQKMRLSVIKDNTYLGPFDHPSKLKVGNTQTMVFDLSHSGPFYMSDREKQDKKYDVSKGTKMIPKNKAQLINRFKSMEGWEMPLFGIAVRSQEKKNDFIFSSNTDFCALLGGECILIDKVLDSKRGSSSFSLNIKGSSNKKMEALKSSLVQNRSNKAGVTWTKATIPLFEDAS